MKKLYYLLAICIIVVSCQDKYIDNVFAELKDHTPYVQHNWTLTKVTQTDENAGPGKLKSLDISSAVLGNSSSTLNFDGQNFTATGAISTGIGTSGTWAFDDNIFPTKIIINSDIGNNEILLGSSILESSETLNLKETRTFCVDGTNSTSYQYIFQKN